MWIVQRFLFAIILRLNMTQEAGPATASDFRVSATMQNAPLNICKNLLLKAITYLSGFLQSPIYEPIDCGGTPTNVAALLEVSWKVVSKSREIHGHEALPEHREI